MHFCCRKTKNSCFAPKTLIYGIFVANVAKTQHTRFEDRILRKLANEDKPQIVPPCLLQMQHFVQACCVSLEEKLWAETEAAFTNNQALWNNKI